MRDVISPHSLDKRVIRTKKAIKESLFSIMEDKDISSITISELTKRANINRRTFYTHYRNITDILDEIECDLVAALVDLMYKFDVNNYKNSAYELFLGLNDLITGEFDYYFRLVRVDMRGLLMARLKNVIKSSTDKLLAQICRRDDDIRVISSFIVGGFFNTYLEWHNDPSTLTVEQAAEMASCMASYCVEKVSRK